MTSAPDDRSGDAYPRDHHPGDDAATFCATIVDEWVRLGVRHAVVAPGSRSTPMAVALVRDGRLSVDVFHDERSASFCALGIAKATGVPAVLLCTSGTAAAHFHAAVVEAHHGAVPMLVCTADRPPELHDVGAPQTIDQQELYGTAVRLFVDAGVPDSAARGHWRALARRCFGVATAHTQWTGPAAPPGPVHLNLPFREPLLGVPGRLPDADEAVATGADAEDRAASVEVAASIVAETAGGRRGVVVAGGGAPLEVVALARALSWPVFADIRSPARHCGESNVVAAFDPLLRVESFAAAHRPEVVLRFGEPPASKVLGQWCAASGAVLVQIGADSRVFDPDRTARRMLVADLAAVAAAAAGAVRSCDDEWLSDWCEAARAAAGAIADAVRSEWSEPAVAAAVTRALNPDEAAVVSSSMPIRDMEWFSPPCPGVVFHSNRGTNGIDGVVSTAVGVARGSACRTTLLIGDIAFIHDINGLVGLAGRGLDLRIVVTNNDGGAIFDFLPQAAALAPIEYETLFGTPHGTRLESLAEAHCIPHVAVGSLESLQRALEHPGPVVIEARTARSTNVAAHDRLYEQVRLAVEDRVGPAVKGG